MGEIISLENKRRESEDREENRSRQRKLRFVRRFLQEARGIQSCERCRTALSAESTPEPATGATRVPYVFCRDCKREYLQYIAHLQGKDDPDAYWRNDSWRDLWQKWIDYKGTLDQYTRSHGFRQLLDELKPPEIEK